MSVNFYVIVLLAFVSPLVQITTSYSTGYLILILFLQFKEIKFLDFTKTKNDKILMYLTVTFSYKFTFCICFVLQQLLLYYV